MDARGLRAGSVRETPRRRLNRSKHFSDKRKVLELPRAGSSCLRGASQRWTLLRFEGDYPPCRRADDAHDLAAGLDVRVLARGPCRNLARGASMAQRGIHNDIATTISPTDLARRRAGAAGRTVAASPARADRCDDIAKQLEEPDRRPQGRHHRRQHDLSVASGGQGAVARLPRPQLFRSSSTPRPTASRSRNSSIWSPPPRAIVFTVPKDDTLTGTSRCIKRMGLLRGDKVSMRYRRLNMECTRTKTEASIAVTRGKDE